MSLATFKKKTQNKVGTMSVGQSQFSINGTRRLQGFVGQNIISRSFPKTPMSNGTAKGHGGNSGTYYTGQSISPLCAGDWTNDPTIVKASVLNNSGQLELRFPPQANDIYKPDDGHHQGTSGQYTEQLVACRTKSIYCSDKRIVNNPDAFATTCCAPSTSSTNYQQRSSQFPTFTKDPFSYTAISQQDYIKALRAQTSQIDQTKYKTMQKPANSPPFGATVQEQPEDQTIAKKYAPINRNFFLRGINRLQQCVPGSNKQCPPPQ
jgi:hypothetical protein